MIKNYVVPIWLLATLLIGLFDDPFRYDLENHISWSGQLGHQNYFHYWYLTNHKLYLLSITVLLAYIVRKDKNSFYIIIAYICYDVYELVNYLYYGGVYFNDAQQQQRETIKIIGFFLTIMILIIKDKWTQRK